jgi:methylenetetrahydrofolate dehydrogenase (NADP+)/methenyltetrahydrofolate cyclohydrolase
MKLLISKPLVESIQESTRKKVAALIDSGISPQMAVVLVGEDPSSLKYVKIKSEQAKASGIIISRYQFPRNVKLEELKETLAFLANDEEIHGIVLQLPLPDQFSKTDLESLINLIPATKDIDGLRGDFEGLTFTHADLESLASPSPYFLPPMILSVFSLLDYYSIDFKDAKIVMVGLGRLVGEPIFLFGKLLGLDIQAVDEETEEILDITTKADLLITGTGVKDLVTYQWVKEGVVVINCSMDVHEDSVGQIASAMSPAIGGIGPLTVSWLLHNLSLAPTNV